MIYQYVQKYSISINITVIMQMHHYMIKCEGHYIQNLHYHEAVEVELVLSLFSQCSTSSLTDCLSFSGREEI
jgi:hypothetical protein